MARRTLGILAAAALALSAGRAGATVLAQDGFEAYSLAKLYGQTGGVGWATGTAWGGANTAAVYVTGASLSYSGGDLLINGGTKAVQVDGVTADNLVNRMFAGSPTGTVWMSFLYRPVSFDANDFVQFSLVDTGHVSSYSVPSIGDLSGTTNVFGTRVTSGAVNAPGAYAADTTYFLVAEVTKTGSATNYYDRVNLYVNPTSAASPGTVSAT